MQLYLFAIVCICLIFAVIAASSEPRKPSKSEFEARGILLIDDITFDKIVPSDRRTTVMLVWNKRELGEYGTESYRSDYYDFAMKAESYGNAENVLFTQLIVNGAQNGAFSERELGLKKDFKRPVTLLWKPGESKPIKKDFGSMNPTDMTKWISTHTLFYYEGAIGIIQEDQSKLALEFMTNVNERNNIIAESKRLIDLISHMPTESYFSGIYLKTMENVIDRGDDYVHNELANIATLLSPESRISNKVMGELKIRRAVLRQFDPELAVKPVPVVTVPVSGSGSGSGLADNTGNAAPDLSL